MSRSSLSQASPSIPSSGVTPKTDHYQDVVTAFIGMMTVCYSCDLMFGRWFKEFGEFFFQKGNALNLAIAVVVGTQFQKIVDALTNDLLMPLLNPFIKSGNWNDLMLPYYGGNIAIGSILDMILNSLIVGWVLFVIMKAINRTQRVATAGVSRLRKRPDVDDTDQDD